MLVTTPTDLLKMEDNGTITKQALFALIVSSKEPDAARTGEKEPRIGNTPQQGINWVGEPPEVQAVLLKSKTGSYEEDGWTDLNRTQFRYALKENAGEIRYQEKANKILIQQALQHYPVMLFLEDNENSPSYWRLAGRFRVVEISTRSVLLARMEKYEKCGADSHPDGNHWYAAHLLAERYRPVKPESAGVCAICGDDVSAKYGTSSLELHCSASWKRISETANYEPADFVMLCPNCHSATHREMATRVGSFDEIRGMFRRRFRHWGEGT